VNRHSYDLTIAGLGPGDPGLLGAEVEKILAAAKQGDVRVFLRTVEHPVAARVAREVEGSLCFDDLYSKFDDYDALYEEMARVVVEAASLAPTAFLVPGSPFVGESAAKRALEAAKESGLEVRVIPGVSFIEAVLCELGVDAVDDGIQVVDAYEIDRTVLGEGAVLVAQCHSTELLSNTKLALLEELPADHLVALVDAASSSDSKVLWVELAELDRCGFTPGHLTSIFVPPYDRAPGRSLRAFVDLVETLRAPGGCPWDAEQTHHSLSRHLLEETYEVLDAIDALPHEAPGGDVDPSAYAVLEEELGDLLFQIAFHSTLAKEAGAFTMGDVARGIHAKLIARHPHVFGTTEVSGASEVAHNWEVIKSAEKRRESLMDDIGTSLPALLLANKMQRRAASAGFDWSHTSGVFEKVEEELNELLSELPEFEKPTVDWAVPPQRVVEEVGDLLFAVVNVARHLRVDPEEALRGAAKRFEHRFRQMEAMAKSEGMNLADLNATELESLWEQAKEGEKD
jgi:tetrapyrrole methylase family protein/MazG family protein